MNHLGHIAILEMPDSIAIEVGPDDISRDRMNDDRSKLVTAGTIVLSGIGGDNAIGRDLTDIMSIAFRHIRSTLLFPMFFQAPHRLAARRRGCCSLFHRQYRRSE